MLGKYGVGQDYFHMILHRKLGSILQETRLFSHDITPEFVFNFFKKQENQIKCILYASVGQDFFKKYFLLILSLEFLLKVCNLLGRVLRRARLFSHDITPEFPFER